MELLSAASPESFDGDECFAFQSGDDSGLSSSPSTPTSLNYDIFADLFDLDPAFCDTVNASLFDGELPAKLYTHIRIKEEDDDELWFSASFPRQIKPAITLSPSEDSSLPDYFNEPYGLADEIVSPSGKPQNAEKINSKPSHRENNSEEISSEDTNSEACTNITAEITEVSSPPKDCSLDETDQIVFKRELRTRRKRVQTAVDHDYCKSTSANNSASESDDEYNIEQEGEDVSDDDEEFKAPCSAKKSRKANSNSSQDEKYWERRRRNNLAAKRSREAKREREIQIAKKTAALEKENANLKKQVRKLKADIKRTEKMLRVMV